MRRLVSVASLVAVPVFAGMVADAGGGDFVRLTDKPCQLEMPSDWQRLSPKAAVGQISGKTFKACWVLVGDAVALKYEDGDYGALPLSAFRNLPEA